MKNYVLPILFFGVFSSLEAGDVWINNETDETIWVDLAHDAMLDGNYLYNSFSIPAQSWHRYVLWGNIGWMTINRQQVERLYGPVPGTVTVFKKNGQLMSEWAPNYETFYQNNG